MDTRVNEELFLNNIKTTKGKLYTPMPCYEIQCGECSICGIVNNKTQCVFDQDAILTHRLSDISDKLKKHDRKG